MIGGVETIAICPTQHIQFSKQSKNDSYLNPLPQLLSCPPLLQGGLLLLLHVLLHHPLSRTKGICSVLSRDKWYLLCKCDFLAQQSVAGFPQCGEEGRAAREYLKRRVLCRLCPSSPCLRSNQSIVLDPKFPIRSANYYGMDTTKHQSEDQNRFPGPVLRVLDANTAP